MHKFSSWFAPSRTLVFAVFAILHALIWLTPAWGQGQDLKNSESKDGDLPISHNGRFFILCSTKKISKGMVIQDRDMQFRSVSKSQCPHDAIDQISFAVGRTAKNVIQKGNPIRLHDIGINLISNCPSMIQYSITDNRPMPVIYTVSTVAKGHFFTSEDLITQRISVNKIPAHALVSPYSVIGRKASSQVGGREFLFPWNVGIESTHKE